MQEGVDDDDPHSDDDDDDDDGSVVVSGDISDNTEGGRMRVGQGSHEGVWCIESMILITMMMMAVIMTMTMMVMFVVMMTQRGVE